MRIFITEARVSSFSGGCCRYWKPSIDCNGPASGPRRELSTYRRSKSEKQCAVAHIVHSSSGECQRESDQAGRFLEMVSLGAGEDLYLRDSSTPGKLRKVISEQTFQKTAKRNRSEDVVIEEDLYLEGVGYVTAILLRDCLTWHLTESDDELVGNSCWRQRGNESALGQILISEAYASELCEMRRPTPLSPCGLLSTPLPEMYRFSVHTFQRSQSNKCNWVPKVYVFCHEDADTCQAWVARLQGLLDCDVHRPRNLLVIVNPFGGKGRGVQEWEAVAPLFDIARVRTKVIFTERAGHGRDVLTNTSEEDLNKLDGVVVVGGDGLFNEVLNGLLVKRHVARSAPKPQQVAEILAKKSKAGKTLQRKAQEDFQSPAFMDRKHGPLSRSSLDVHSPLLETLSYPPVDMSRATTSSSASSSGCSSFSRSTAQLESASTSLHPTASLKEIELSLMETETELLGGKGIEGDHHKTKEGISEFSKSDEVRRRSASSKDGTDLHSLADTAQHKNNLRESNLQLRIGIIPCGSTDTVAISTTGSRDPVTAAVHILLGDSLPLDVVKVTRWKRSPQSGNEPPEVRYAASFAGYGFYGDVMKESETTRWLGPARYDFAGVKVFMKHREYEAEVSFLDVSSTSSSVDSNPGLQLQRKTICRENCAVCDEAVDLNHLVGDDGEVDQGLGELQLPKPKWRTTQGSFHSIGAAVMSCRNDKAPDGISAHAHLADGLLHLILIRSCSRPNYLRQLITLTQKGADPFGFHFVEHYKTPVFTFVSHGTESVWNVDGELFPAHQLSAQCFRGLVNVFARGPEL